MFDTIKSFIDQHPHLVELAAFALGFAESIIVTSFFVPATAIFLAVGAMMGAGGNLLWPVVLAAGLGAFVGDVVTYVLANRYRHSVATWPALRDNPNWMPQATAFVERWGWLSLLLGKFVGPLRPVVPIVCGVMRMNVPLFLVSSAVSSIFWAATFLVPPYYGLMLWNS
jgi:undecaprenyl-diphosphatase